MLRTLKLLRGKERISRKMNHLDTPERRSEVWYKDIAVLYFSDVSDKTPPLLSILIQSHLLHPMHASPSLFPPLVDRCLEVSPPDSRPFDLARYIKAKSQKC